MKTATYLILFIVFSGIFFSCADRSSDPLIPPKTPTEVSGIVSGIWAQDDSPIIVTGDVQVPANQTLSIEPGTLIQFENGFRMTVNGQLDAIGTDREPIRFTAADVHWRGIHIVDATGSSSLMFCNISGGGSDAQLDSTGNGILEVRNSTADIRNSVFTGNNGFTGGGIAALNGAIITVKNCIFYQNQSLVYGGGMFVMASQATIINNTFYKNYSDNVGGGLVLFNPISVQIQNNIFYQNDAPQGLKTIYFARPDSGVALIQYNFTDLALNPAFIDEGNLHISAGSPCQNAGNPDPAFNDVDLTRNDQGAFGGPGGDWNP